jgi:hypothetical protein
MNQADLQSLLRDVNTLAQYAARNGKLPPRSKAFELIAALEAIPAPDNSGALTTQLHVEMDSLAKAIAPMTLRQLQPESLTERLRHVFAIATPFVIGFLTILLTIYLAFQSSQLHQADTALREYQDWIAQQPKEKLYAAFKMYRYEHALKVTQPPLAQLDAYQKLSEDAHQLAKKGAAIQSLLVNASVTWYIPPILEYMGPFQDFVKRLNHGQGIEKDFQLANYNEEPPVSAADGAPATPCAAVPVQAAKGQSGQLDIEIDGYMNSWRCFLNGLNIDEVQFDYSPWNVIYDTKSKVNLLVTWLLPGLYGLLGSCVYLMRDFVLTGDAGLRRDRSILSEMLLLLRIALGGLAGIIIGWFWVPPPVGNGNTVVAISSIPFGIAFLAGFSIETLFTLLDRLNKKVENPKPAEPQAKKSVKTGTQAAAAQEEQPAPAPGA